MGLTKAMADAFANSDESQKLDETISKAGKAGGLLAKTQHDGANKLTKSIASAFDALGFSADKETGQYGVEQIAAKATQLSGAYMGPEDVAGVLKDLGVKLKPEVQLPDPNFQDISKMFGVKTGMAAADAMKKDAEAKIGTLSKDEHSAVRSYTGSGYLALNREMRKCPPNFECLSGHLKSMMDNVQSALDKAGPLPEPVFVKRGITVDSDTVEKLLKGADECKATGEYFPMPCFSSTSVEKGFSGNFRFQILARTGLYVEPMTAVTGEYEVLQSPKAKYKVIGWKKQGKTAILQLEEVI
jgi:hypothetical protein